MVHNPIISIIIPVYNVQDYLPECLDSLVKQTKNEFEVILINDGSTDNSLNICKEYKNKLSNCLIIEQKNQGVSAARNRGIFESSGEYIYFLDSDDILNIHFIETLAKEIKLIKHEVFIFGYNKINANGKQINEIIPKNEVEIQKNENFENLFDSLNCGLGLAVWDKIIKASLIKDNLIKFKKMRNAEDFVFCLEIYSKAKTIKVLKLNLYNYRIQLEGKRNDNYDLPQNHMIAMDKLMELVQNYNNENIDKFISKTAVIWFSIVNPLNISTFGKLKFNEKIKLINLTYKWDKLDNLKQRVQKKYLNNFERFTWNIFNTNSSLVMLTMGFFLSKIRKLMYN